MNSALLQTIDLCGLLNGQTVMKSPLLPGSVPTFPFQHAKKSSARDSFPSAEINILALEGTYFPFKGFALSNLPVFISE